MSAKLSTMVVYIQRNVYIQAQYCKNIDGCAKGGQNHNDVPTKINLRGMNKNETENHISITGILNLNRTNQAETPRLVARTKN